MKTKNKGGRPLLWTDPDKLQELVDEYFEVTERVTLSGLALFLGIDRQTLYNYEKKDAFFGTIKNARSRVEAFYEERAIYESQPTGVIFALKNMGWSDKLDSDIKSGGEPIRINVVGGGFTPNADNNS